MQKHTGGGNLDGNVLTFSTGCEGIRSGFKAKMASNSICFN